MRFLAPCLGLIVVAGCGEAPLTPRDSAMAVGRDDTSKNLNHLSPPGTGPARSIANFSGGAPSSSKSEGTAVGYIEHGAAEALTQTSGEDTLAARVAPSVPRRIIYSADISLVVEDFARAQAEIPVLVQKARGYIAEQDLLGSPGSRRSARWKLRVPVEVFESFLTDVAGLGELERNSRTSQDITEQFADIDARVKNKKVEESRLQKILEENTGKIEDVLKVETELSRVRGEIEQMEGRLRLLDNLSSLTTVSLIVNEREKFLPPPPVAASFPTRVSRALDDSWRALIETGEKLVLWFVAVLPWLPLYLVAGFIAFFLARWFLRWAVRNARRGWTLLNVPIGRSTATPAGPTA
jgi:hypothetical protein